MTTTPAPRPRNRQEIGTILVAGMTDRTVARRFANGRVWAVLPDRYATEAEAATFAPLS